LLMFESFLTNVHANSATRGLDARRTNHGAGPVDRLSALSS
jgi:hypothetical protein